MQIFRDFLMAKYNFATIESLRTMRIAYIPFGVTHPLQALSRDFRVPLCENTPPRGYVENMI